MFSLVTLEWLAWSKGLATSAGLIMAIGAQNAFLLSQSLKRQFHWPVALLCILFDALLITAGVAGLGVLISHSPLLLEVARWGGALFLLVYGAKALHRALFVNEQLSATTGVSSLKRALLTTAAVTLLNPHAYIDTLVLIGSIGGQYDGGLRTWFTVGAICASVAWFLSLCIGARALQPLFSKPVAWRVLDALVGTMMWTIAGTLIISL